MTKKQGLKKSTRAINAPLSPGGRKFLLDSYKCEKNAKKAKKM